ncbi:MAG: phosphonate ABC transporter ATP-binding protein [Bifidobacteriaceae bacterium]|nr:phosphonate ABC transporter ATP-binding protein [Bifidobacteriaceae bacterium]
MDDAVVPAAAPTPGTSGVVRAGAVDVLAGGRGPIGESDVSPAAGPASAVEFTARADQTEIVATPVELRAVTRRFGDTVALDGVDLTVTKGEVVALLGLSGSGKSTMLRQINGLDQPTSGKVITLGQSVDGLNQAGLRRLRSSIGMIFQQFELVGMLTVLENVLTGGLARLRGPRLGTWSYPQAAKLEALDYLWAVGLADRAFQRADTLSGGQSQRVAIARALMQRPSLLLADEPVASLDPESTADVMLLLRQIARDKGLTVLCSLHQVDLAMGWADRLVALRSGRVVLDESAAALNREQVMAVYRPVPSNSAK